MALGSRTCRWTIILVILGFFGVNTAYVKSFPLKRHENSIETHAYNDTNVSNLQHVPRRLEADDNQQNLRTFDNEQNAIDSDKNLEQAVEYTTKEMKNGSKESQKSFSAETPEEGKNQSTNKPSDKMSLSSKNEQGREVERKSPEETPKSAETSEMIKGLEASSQSIESSRALSHTSSQATENSQNSSRTKEIENSSEVAESSEGSSEVRKVSSQATESSQESSETLKESEDSLEASQVPKSSQKSSELREISSEAPESSQGSFQTSKVSEDSSELTESSRGSSETSKVSGGSSELTESSQEPSEESKGPRDPLEMTESSADSSKVREASSEISEEGSSELTESPRGSSETSKVSEGSSELNESTRGSSETSKVSEGSSELTESSQEPFEESKGPRDPLEMTESSAESSKVKEVSSEISEEGSSELTESPRGPSETSKVSEGSSELTEGSQEPFEESKGPRDPLEMTESSADSSKVREASSEISESFQEPSEKTKMPKDSLQGTENSQGSSEQAESTRDSSQSTMDAEKLHQDAKNLQSQSSNGIENDFENQELIASQSSGSSQGEENQHEYYPRRQRRRRGSESYVRDSREKPVDISSTGENHPTTEIGNVSIDSNQYEKQTYEESEAKQRRRSRSYNQKNSVNTGEDSSYADRKRVTSQMEDPPTNSSENERESDDESKATQRRRSGGYHGQKSLTKSEDDGLFNDENNVRSKTETSLSQNGEPTNDKSESVSGLQERIAPKISNVIHEKKSELFVQGSGYKNNASLICRIELEGSPATEVSAEYVNENSAICKNVKGVEAGEAFYVLISNDGSLYSEPYKVLLNSVHEHEEENKLKKRSIVFLVVLFALVLYGLHQLKQKFFGKTASIGSAGAVYQSVSHTDNTESRGNATTAPEKTRDGFDDQWDFINEDEVSKSWAPIGDIKKPHVRLDVDNGHEANKLTEVAEVNSVTKAKSKPIRGLGAVKTKK